MDHSAYVNQVSQELTIMGIETLDQLVKSWEVIYEFNEERKKIMADKFKNHCKDFLQSMADSETERVDKLQEDINHHITEKASLERELGVTIPFTEDIANQPLIKKKEFLNNLLKSHREVKIARLAQMSELQQQLTSLKTKLGLENSAPFEFAEVPSENDLICIRSEIMELLEEKNMKIDHLNQMKNDFQSLLYKLEFPEESLNDSSNITLNLLLSLDKDDWPLQTKQVQLLNELLLNFQNKLVQAKQDKESLLKNLESLWKVNKEDPQYQNDFVSANNLYGDKTFDKINEEIDRCKKIRKDRAKELTLQLREEIKTLWSRLGLSKEKCESFKLMAKEEFSVELLDEHDTYLKKLTSYYDKYKDLFRLIEDRNKMWLAWVELEMKVLDKNRFNNRGGQLLKEGKERSILEKKLPKIEKEILKKVQAHLDAEREPFLWQGQDIQVVIDSDHKKLEALKQEMKISKSIEQKSSGSAVKRKLLTPSGSKNVKKLPRKAVISRILDKTVTLSSVDCNMVFSSPLLPERTPISSPAITPVSSIRQPLVERVKQEIVTSESDCIVISSPDEPSCVIINSSPETD